MALGTQLKATVDDLYREKGKAELIGGRIIPLLPTGRKPNRTAARIFKSLDDFAEATGQVEACTDNMGVTVPELSSGRESFSPDVSFYSGPFPANDMRFIAGPRTFAVEVRSQSDYGEAAEEEMAAKRADYFEAGTRVVWDVDPKAESVNIYRHDAPEHPITRGRGETADATPSRRFSVGACPWTASSPESIMGLDEARPNPSWRRRREGPVPCWTVRSR